MAKFSYAMPCLDGPASLTLLRGMRGSCAGVGLSEYFASLFPFGHRDRLLRSGISALEQNGLPKHSARPSVGHHWQDQGWADQSVHHTGAVPWQSCCGSVGSEAQKRRPNVLDMSRSGRPCKFSKEVNAKVRRAGLSGRSPGEVSRSLKDKGAADISQSSMCSLWLSGREPIMYSPVRKSKVLREPN